MLKFSPRYLAAYYIKWMARCDKYFNPGPLWMLLCLCCIPEVLDALLFASDTSAIWVVLLHIMFAAAGYGIYKRLDKKVSFNFGASVSNGAHAGVGGRGGGAGGYGIGTSSYHSNPYYSSSYNSTYTTGAYGGGVGGGGGGGGYYGNGGRPYGYNIMGGEQRDAFHHNQNRTGGADKDHGASGWKRVLSRAVGLLSGLARWGMRVLKAVLPGSMLRKLQNPCLWRSVCYILVAHAVLSTAKDVIFAIAHMDIFPSAVTTILPFLSPPMHLICLIAEWSQVALGVRLAWHSLGWGSARLTKQHRLYSRLRLMAGACVFGIFEFIDAYELVTVEHVDFMHCSIRTALFALYPVCIHLTTAVGLHYGIDSKGYGGGDELPMLAGLGLE